MSPLDRMTMISKYLSEGECFSYYKFCMESGRDWDSYREHLLKKHATSHIERVERYLIEKYEIDDVHFLEKLEKKGKNLKALLPSLNVKDLLKNLYISLPDGILALLKAKNPQDVESFLSEAKTLVPTQNQENQALSEQNSTASSASVSSNLPLNNAEV